MQKNVSVSTITTFTILLCILAAGLTIVAAQPPTIVKGYVYIDGIVTQPDEVSLMFPDQMRFASVYDDGRYIIIFENEETGITGTFLIIYQNVEYTPPETVTLQSDIYVYDIDLHIETSDGDQPPDEPEDPTNIQPKANAGGPYYEIVNVPVHFNGRESYDSDGHITKYEWDFGDGTTTTGVSSTHTYQEVNNYRIKLTVTDNKGKTDLDITYAYITETPNNPPNQPIINGTISGSINSQYNYTILSTDSDNDTMQYIIDWGDDTDFTISDFLPNGTVYTANHSWMYQGIYTLTAYAIDEEDIISQTAEQVILIDTIYCGDLGYMTDYTSDSIYDLFHSNTTGEETPVEQVNELYLIDDDNDGEYDYQYDTITMEVSAYVQPETNEQKTNLMDLITPLTPFILIAMIILLILVISVAAWKIRKESKKKKVYNVKEKKKTKAKKTASNPKDKGIEDEIDKFLSKKKK